MERKGMGVEEKYRVKIRRGRMEWEGMGVDEKDRVKIKEEGWNGKGRDGSG